MTIVWVSLGVKWLRPEHIRLSIGLYDDVLLGADLVAPYIFHNLSGIVNRRQPIALYIMTAIVKDTHRLYDTI